MSGVEHVTGPDDFHKVSDNEMAHGFRKLENVVRPAVEDGAGSEHSYRLDQEAGYDYVNGYQRVYDAFYGHDSIRLEKDEDGYRVINGAHRVYVAKQLGIEAVRARATEKRRRTD